MISPFYGINPAQAENPYFFLYFFQDLNDVIMSYKFSRVIILEGEDLVVKEFNERRPEDQKGGSHAATVPGRVGPSNLVLGAQFASILHPEASSWPKNTYIKGPPAFFDGRAATRKKQETETTRLQIRGGKLRRSPAGEVSFFSIDISTVSMMKRE